MSTTFTNVEGLDLADACDKLWNITKQLLIAGARPANKNDFQDEVADRIVVLEPTNNSRSITIALAVTHTAVRLNPTVAEKSAVTMQVAIEAL